MSDPHWRRAEIDSPCVKLCVLHPEARICLGCYRTADEIATWSRLDPETRAEITAALPERKALIPGRRGGRAARLARKAE